MFVRCRSQLLLVSGVMLAGSAFAAGYEKANLWSGRYQGIGGAAASSVEGSESMFFNPAGLTKGNRGDTEISVNVSPTYARSKGPLTNDNQEVDGNRIDKYPVALLGKYSISPELAFGAGAYASAGFGADFGTLDFTSLGVSELKPEYMSDLSVLEFAIGVGYEPIEGLRFGLAWHASYVNATFRLPQYIEQDSLGTGFPPVPLLFGVEMNDLTDTQWLGLRGGVQYAPSDLPFGLGLSVRTPVTFKVTGKVTGREAAGTGASNALTEGDVSVENSLPLAVNVGAHWDIVPEFTVFGQYDWTQYSANEKLDFTGSFRSPTIAAISPDNATITLSDIEQKWSDMHMFRLGAEYRIDALSLRAGYVRTSAVTPKGYARPNFFAPGPGNTYVFGAGYKMLGDALAFDGAFEYSADGGTVTAPEQAETHQGEYSAYAYTYHLGASYAF